MALVKCKECGHEVSEQAATCPSCGIAHPALSDAVKAAATEAVKSSGWARLSGIAFFVGLAWVIFPMMTGAGRDAVAAAWDGGAKVLIFGGAGGYIWFEIMRNLAAAKAKKMQKKP